MQAHCESPLRTKTPSHPTLHESEVGEASEEYKRDLFRASKLETKAKKRLVNGSRAFQRSDHQVVRLHVEDCNGSGRLEIVKRELLAKWCDPSRSVPVDEQHVQGIEQADPHRVCGPGPSQTVKYSCKSRTCGDIPLSSKSA